jgi:hypothetical protein
VIKKKNKEMPNSYTLDIRTTGSRIPFRLDGKPDPENKTITFGQYVNHSCDPNCCFGVFWYYGQLIAGAVTMRPIHPGEFLTVCYEKPERIHDWFPVCYCGADCCSDKAIFDEKMAKGEIVWAVAYGF